MEKKEKIVDEAQFEFDSVNINQFNLNDEFVKLPAQLAYWNAKYADASERYLLYKSELEDIKARVLLYERSKIRKSNVKITVDEINSRVLTDDEVVVATNNLIKSEVEKVRIKGIIDAIHVKKDMLQMLGSKLKIEMEHDPMLRDHMTCASSKFYRVTE